jgi:hypothetical protein
MSADASTSRAGGSLTASTGAHRDKAGTTAGYYRHYHAGQPSCGPCLAAIRAYQTARRAALQAELGRTRRASRASVNSEWVDRRNQW